LISISIQDIQENPQDTSNFYLANIYQTLADPNGSNISTSPPPSPPPFSPPNYAVWVNALWFLSLVISLTCALLATLLQQWARRYLKIAHSRYTPHKRARIRAFFAEGVEKCLLPWAVETLPTLLHTSLFLFFAGLVVFLSNVHLTIFKLVLSWVGVCAALYGCVTCMPIIRHDSPYYTPLSLPAWHIVTGIPFVVYRFLRWFNESVRFSYGAYYRFLALEESCRKSLVRGMQKTAEETALKSPPEIDARAFMWTFDCLDEDHELERFFSGLPGFRSSTVVNDPLPSLTEEQKRKIYEALRGLLDRTFSSDLLPATVKNRRAMISAKAVDPRHTPIAFIILKTILFEYQYSGPLATAIAQILRVSGDNMDQGDIFYAQFAISKIIATRQPFDDSWYILASNELGFPEASLRDYAAHGDNLSFVILIHLVRQQFTHFWKLHWLRTSFAFLLAESSKFNVQDTSPELQHKFCALWNEIVLDGIDWEMSYEILGRIRNIYLALHQDTNSAPTQFSASTSDDDDILWEHSSYPLCNVPDHCSDTKLPIHDNSVGSALAVLHAHDKTALVPSFVTHSPDPAAAPAHAPLRIQENLTNAPPLDNNLSASVQTQPTTEVCSSSPNLVTAGATHRNLDNSPNMAHPPTLECSAFTVPPKSNPSTSPQDAVTVRPTVGHTSSTNVELPSSPPRTPVQDHLPPIGMRLRLDSAVT
jgi:hypothetical protein